MKKIGKIIKNNYKIVLGIMIGILITGTTVYAATAIAGKDITYSNTTSGLSATTVQGAIDEIYEKSKTHCPEGYKCTLLPKYFAFGKPTTSSTTDYTTLGKNVFTTLYSDGKTGGVCINDGGLFCLQANDYDNSETALNAQFGKTNCEFDWEYNAYICKLGYFRCFAYYNGVVDCYDISAGGSCSASADGSFSCD